MPLVLCHEETCHWSYIWWITLLMSCFVLLIEICIEKVKKKKECGSVSAAAACLKEETVWKGHRKLSTRGFHQVSLHHHFSRQQRQITTLPICKSPQMWTNLYDKHVNERLWKMWNLHMWTVPNRSATVCATPGILVRVKLCSNVLSSCHMGNIWRANVCAHMMCISL